ncbi:MAG: biphenyl 2,3-dioxygenase [SAR324 cluster bacterium]|nr:biphenyl 2,3-dioxygenase [SAR324 cluster bacterium]
MKALNIYFKISLAMFFLIILGQNLWAKGDLTETDINKITVEISNEKGDYVFNCIDCENPKLLKFETGKAYKLVLLNKSKQKHYFTSYSLARLVFTRKVHVFKGLEVMDGWAAEVKGNVTEIEIAPMTKTDWYFVPVKTGKGNDVHCHITESDGKNVGKSHADLGMTMSYEVY